MIYSKRIILTIIFLSSALSFFAQPQVEALKKEALNQMKFGRYGEAIDLLNRYVSANPQNPEGYNLRGLAYEKRGQYELSVYDFRSARKLKSNDKDINQNLARTTEAWYKLLYNKIEGHKREIAINPNKALNYLEIGKCYKNLGEWAEAEIWYDEYLKREEASCDEIIRYSEILAKNNHIAKGEPILKKYTRNYPDDWRIWSRYGYFTLWLGKNKTAIDAFEHALAIKPYFKEALDGLDQAKGKGYIYTVNDTSYKYYKSFGFVPKKMYEYAIDKYFRALKKNPADNETRFKLVEELEKANRFYEALEQLQILSNEYSGNDRYETLYTRVTNFRDSIYNAQIEKYSNIVSKDPGDEEALLKLAEFYGGMQDYDKALENLDKYLLLKDKNASPEVRYLYARYAAWNYEFDKGIEQLNILLKDHPDNLDYQLLRAQIAVWTGQDLEMAKIYLDNVLASDKNNINALVALSSLKIKEQDFIAAKEYLDRARLVNPGSKEVETIQIYYDVSYSNAEGLKIYQILYDARDKFVAGECRESIELYNEYFSKITGPTRIERIEYANANICAKEYGDALTVVDELLAEEYDFDIAVLRGKIYLWLGDSAAAMNEFEKLVKERPEDFDANLSLAIAYAYNQKYDEAENIYENLLRTEVDTSKISIVKAQMSWLPKGGGFAFPTHLAISPFGGFYNDNQNFTYRYGGGRFELGLTNFLTLGASFQRSVLDSSGIRRNLSAFKGHVYINFSKKFRGGAGFGTLTTLNTKKKNIMDAYLRFEEDKLYWLNASFERTDARMILFSPGILNINMQANLFRLQGNYSPKTGLRLSGYTSYLSAADDNSANDFQIRLGKKFYSVMALGYEYFYVHYSKKSPFYYSPQNFESHSIWAEWDAVNDTSDNVKLTFGGKLGYIPTGDFITREIYGELNYELIDHLILAGRVTAGNTYRFETGYNYFSAYISAYWGFF